MKIGAIVIVNCDKDNIWYCLKGIYRGCDKIIVVHSDCNWNGESKDDGTLEITRSFEDPDNKIEIITGSYTSQPGQRTIALEILKNEEYDYCFVVDSDEIYHPEQVLWAKAFIKNNPSIDIFRVRWLRLWKTLSYKLIPDDGEVSAFYKITDDFYFTQRRGTTYRTRQLGEKALEIEIREEKRAVRLEAMEELESARDGLKLRKKQKKKEQNTKRIKMRRERIKEAEKRERRAWKVLKSVLKQIEDKVDSAKDEKVKVEFMDPEKIVCYHLTTVCDDEQMLEKIQTRSYKDRIHPDWYQNKWLDWAVETRNLHPTSPAQYERAKSFHKGRLPSFMKTHRFWNNQ